MKVGLINKYPYRAKIVIKYTKLSFSYINPFAVTGSLVYVRQRANLEFQEISHVALLHEFRGKSQGWEKLCISDVKIRRCSLIYPAGRPPELETNAFRSPSHFPFGNRPASSNVFTRPYIYERRPVMPTETRIRHERGCPLPETLFYFIYFIFIFLFLFLGGRLCARGRKSRDR